jgi:signal transduction histidine kinase
MNIARTIALLILFASASNAFGQETDDFTEHHYTGDNGLPQNSVMQIRMDKNGFLWMSTQGGLVRFDGTRFLTYNVTNVAGLISNRIIEIALTGDSTIYFKDTSFKVFSFDKNNQSFLLNPRIRNRAVVINSPQEQFDVIRNLVPQDRRRVESVLPKFATQVAYDRVGAMEDGFLRVNESSLFYLSGKRIVFQRYFTLPSAMSLLNSGILNKVLYYFNEDRRLSGINSSGREYPVFPKMSTESGATLTFTGPSHFYQQGDKLFLRNSNTFYELEPAPGNVLICKPILKTAALNNVYCYLYIPQADMHILGTGTDGVYIFKKKQFKTVHIPGTSSNFYSQHIYQKNGVLTELGAILPGNIRSPEPFPLAARSGILVDREGYVWVTNRQIDALKLSPDLKPLKKFTVEREVSKFAQTPDGNIWMTTSSGKFGKVSGDSVQWVKMSRGAKMFIPETNTRFWMSDGLGVFRVDVQKSSVQELPELKGKEVRTFYFDKRRTLWTGTYGQGFYAIRNGKATALPLDRNGHLLVVHTFLEDKKGFLWMSTNHGLFKCRIQDLYDYLDRKSENVFYYYYDKSNGFANNEFNGGCSPSSVVFPDGRFSFPSMDGLVQVYPDSIQDILPNARILIDKFHVDGIEKPFSDDLRLEPSFNRIEVLLASSYFGLPENQLLEYNIKGLDNEWYELNNNLAITLNRLGYGDYELQVRKRTGFGRANVGLLTKKFTVAPFWYQTWYFKLFVIALLAYSFYLVVKLRYHYLTLRKKQLEAQVLERTMQLEYSNRLKEKITLLLAHDLQSPLHFLNLLSDHVAASLEKHRLEDVGNGISEIKKAASNIHAFVKEINLWTKSQQEGFYLSKRPFPFDELADELRQFFKEMLLFKKNTLEIANPEKLDVFTNREILKAVIRNLIDNSNKYTSGGNIRVELEKVDERFLRLSVSDNGRGMSPADLSKINRRIENVLTTAGIEQSGRLGYQIIIDFVARLDCKLEVTSITGKGTTVTITGLPLSQPDATEALMTDTAPPNFTTL